MTEVTQPSGVAVSWLGRVAYEEASRLQQELVSTDPWGGDRLLLLGFLLGLGLGLSSAGDGRLPALPPAAVWIGVGLIAAAAGTLTLVWLRRADEVEISDQLWSGFVGLQVFAIGAPCWEMLAAAEAAPPA